MIAALAVARELVERGARRGEHDPLPGSRLRPGSVHGLGEGAAIFHRRRTGQRVPMTAGRDVWWDDFLTGQPADAPTERTAAEDGDEPLSYLGGCYDPPT